MRPKKKMPMKEDRISKLPDAILLKILALIDLKLAIRTSILSKRWKPLWTSLPNLNFDFDYYRSQTPSYGWHSRAHDEAVLRPYSRFVDLVLSHRDNHSTICKFRLACSINVDPIFVKNCVDYAISHNVQDLDIAAYHHPKPFEFPPNFFTCRSLQKLQLKQDTSSMVIPKPFFLPTLKTLNLERFSFKDDDPFCFPKEPFSVFPNLEKLTLNCCTLDGLIILAPELRILELLFRGHHPLFSSESTMGKVSTPKLSLFKFEGHVSLVCPMEELPCLEKVDIDLYPVLEKPYTDEVEQKMPLNLIKFLEQLKNAKFVTLSLETIQVLALDICVLQNHPSPFCNLKHLKFVSDQPWRIPKPSPPQEIIHYVTNASSRSEPIVEFAKHMAAD